MERLQMSLSLHLSPRPLFNLICSHINHIQKWISHICILCTSRHVKMCAQTQRVNIHTLTFSLISPCRASRYSYISVQSEKGSCRQFSLNLRISILSWKPLFTRGCAATPSPPFPNRIKLNVAKAKQQCITTLCDIFRICEIEQTK